MEQKAQKPLTAGEYAKMVQKEAPKSHLLLNCLNAFWTGGTICLFGEGFRQAFTAAGVSEENGRCLTSVLLVFVGSMLTAFGVYDKIAKLAGAGTLVPITGFSNAVTAPAIEFFPEGLVTGTGARMFTIAGPVIVYGTAASVLYGLFLWAGSFL